MNFSSDNVSAVSPAILSYLASMSSEAASPYGADAESLALRDHLRIIFEKPDLEVFPLTTGTAANSIAIAAMVDPWGAVICHKLSHINVDECGAPEFYSGGAKLLLCGEGDPVNDTAKLTPETIRQRAANMRGIVHRVQPQAISLSNLTELGGDYSPQELAEIGKTARELDLSLHLDGARFANALALHNCAPADLSWKAGVDMLSFGATKNGAMAAEALIVFNPAQAEPIAFRRKRAGHLWSKQRYLSGQLMGYLKDDLWLENARTANDYAQQLRQGLVKAGIRMVPHTRANMLFVQFPPDLVKRLQAEGFYFYPWEDIGPDYYRLITSWNSKPEDVEKFIACVQAG